MTTAAQIRANRLNAKRNTGPSTTEAKAHVAQNGIKHGLTAQQTVLSHENVDEYHDLMATFISEYQPINTREALCVERIARHHWRMLRAGRVETALFEHRIDTLIRTEHAEDTPTPTTTPASLSATTSSARKSNSTAATKPPSSEPTTEPSPTWKKCKANATNQSRLSKMVLLRKMPVTLTTR